jgi:hypothetical protein
MIAFEDLVGRLPAGGLPGSNTDVLGVAAEMETFVSPTLRVVEEEEGANVTLISARGATGKSTLAQQLSSVTGAPLWRLEADVTVSADALASRLATYLGPDDPLGRFLASRDAFLIIDSLDEARMRVSGASWGEFMRSMIEAARGGHRFVLLGRERILDDVWLDLADAGLTTQWFEISHFDAVQRQDYVDTRVRARGFDATSAAYAGAQDAVLDALQGTVPGLAADAFVGYAPVLDAVVELLGGHNLIAIQNMFSGEMQGSERTAVLERVLVSLLDREQGKVEPLAEQLDLDAQRAYTAEEQVEWLAAELLGGDPPSLDWCPAVTRAEYAKRVESFLGDHPFRSEAQWASPVFSAYVAAQRFGDPQIRGSLQPVGAVTGLLYEFMAHGGGAEVIDEWQFAALHASLLAAEQHEVEAAVTIAGGNEAGGRPLDHAEGELALLADGTVQRRLAFELVLDTADRLRLLGSSSYLSVEFPGRVDVEPTSSTLALGPDLYISCQDLHLGGETVQVLRRAMRDETTGDDASLILHVTGGLACDAMLTGNPPTGVFELHVPSAMRLAYPWVTYRHELETADAEPDERAERFLRMLMNLVRRHGKKDWAVFDKKLQGRQTIKGDSLTNVLSALASMGVVSLQSSMVILNEPWASARFDGKGRPGLPSLDDHRATWQPVLDTISATLSR